LGLRDLL